MLGRPYRSLATLVRSQELTWLWTSCRENHKPRNYTVVQLKSLAMKGSFCGGILSYVSDLAGQALCGTTAFFESQAGGATRLQHLKLIVASVSCNAGKCSHIGQAVFSLTLKWNMINSQYNAVDLLISSDWLNSMYYGMGVSHIFCNDSATPGQRQCCVFTCRSSFVSNSDTSGTSECPTV